MANQTAIRAHTEPGDEIIAHEGSHIIHYETGAPAALSGVMIRPIVSPRGIFDVADLEPMVRPHSSHFARSRLLVLENTHNRGGGSVWPLEQLQRVARRGRELGLRVHLDGARLWNASVKTGIKPSEWAAPFDTVSCCFSKGLGCPAGSAVAGDRASIERVHRFRKMFGGTMRQSGVLAAAALHALDHHIDRLSQDHANATRLARGIVAIEGLEIQLDEVETNMVFFDLAPRISLNGAQFCERLRAAGVLMMPTAPRRIRAVCHLDVSESQIDAAIAALRKTAAEAASAGRERATA
jgi:threonine aldolase